MSLEEKRFCFSCKLDVEQLMKKNKKLKSCSFCKIAQYCGQECQRRDFKDNHKRICIDGFKHMRDLGEKAKNILEEKGHNLDRSSLQVFSYIISQRLYLAGKFEDKKLKTHFFILWASQIFQFDAKSFQNNCQKIWNFSANFMILSCL